MGLQEAQVTLPVSKGQGELPCMSPVGRAGARRAPSQLRDSCPQVGQAGLALEGVGAHLWRCVGRNRETLPHTLWRACPVPTASGL